MHAPNIWGCSSCTAVVSKEALCRTVNVQQIWRSDTTQDEGGLNGARPGINGGQLQCVRPVKAMTLQVVNRLQLSVLPLANVPESVDDVDDNK